MLDSKIFWDKAAPKYAKSAIDDMEGYLQTLERTKSYLEADDQILEVGCGTGSTALLLSQHVSHITASDLSDNMIQIANKKAQDQNITNAKFISADVMHGFDDTQSFDAILALNLIHLLEHPAQAIQNMHKLLKPGGYFISKTVCQLDKSTSWKFRLLKLILPIMQAFGKAPFVNFMPIEILEQHITDAGFHIIEAGSYPSRYIVAQKI